MSFLKFRLFTEMRLAATDYLHIDTYTLFTDYYMIIYLHLKMFFEKKYSKR